MSGGQLCIKDIVPQAAKTQINTVTGKIKINKRHGRRKANGLWRWKPEA